MNLAKVNYFFAQIFQQLNRQWDMGFIINEL